MRNGYEVNNMFVPEKYTGTIAASGTATIGPFDLQNLRAIGFFSLQSLVSGDGTMQITYELSNVSSTIQEAPADAEFLAPTGTSDIVTAQTKTSGPGSDGLDLYQFPTSGAPIFAKWIRFILNETSTTDEVTYTIYPNIQ